MKPSTIDTAAAPSVMSVAQIQTRLDALGKAMVAKALVEPSADFQLASAVGPRVHLMWKTKNFVDGYKSFRGEPAKALADADAFVDALPAPAVARMAAFLTHLDETIQLGKKADVEVEAINPLREIFKRISKNAITHQVQA